MNIWASIAIGIAWIMSGFVGASLLCKLDPMATDENGKLVIPKAIIGTIVLLGPSALIVLTVACTLYGLGCLAERCCTKGGDSDD